jgi:hypothetical protein
MFATVFACGVFVVFHAAEADAAQAPSEPPPEWNGTLGLSLIAVRGNAESITLSATGTAERITPWWRWSARVAASYGQARLQPDQPATVIALAAAVQLRGDRALSTRTSLFALAGAEMDHVKSIEHRPFGEAGFAIRWIEQKVGEDTVLLLRTDLGARYGYESRFQYYPVPLDLDDVQIFAPRVGIGFRYAVSEHLTAIEEAEVLVNVVGPTRTLATSLTRLQAQLLGPLALSVGLQINHDSAAAAGKKPNDIIFSTGVELGF